MIRTDEGRMNSTLQTLMSGCLCFFIVSDSDMSIITQLHRSFFQIYTPHIGRFLKFRTCDIWTFEIIIILAVKISFFTVINRIWQFCNLMKFLPKLPKIAFFSLAKRVKKFPLRRKPIADEPCLWIRAPKNVCSA